MAVVEKITRKITDVLGVIAGVMILVMMLLAVLDVVLRAFFSSPIIGATEIIQILNVGIVVALGAGTVKNQHVTVDFVMDKVPKVPRFYVQLVVDVLNIAILAAEPARAEGEANIQRNFDNMLKQTMTEAGKHVVVLEGDALAEWEPVVQPTVDRILADMEASHPGFGAMYADLKDYVANYGA